MDRLRELLALWNDEESRAAMSLDEIRELEVLLSERADEIAAEIGDGRPNDEQLNELAEIADELDGENGVRSAITAGEEQEEADRQRASDLLERIRAQEGDGGEGGDGGEPGEGDQTGAGDGGEGGEGDATGGEGGDAGATTGEPGEGDAGGEAGDAGTGEGDQGGGTQSGGETVEPIAASPAPRRSSSSIARRPIVSRVAARRPDRVRPRASGDGNPQYALTASANVQNAGIHAGQRLEDPEDIGAAFLSAWESTQGYSGQGPMKVSVAFAGGRRPEDVWPEERLLTADAMSNASKLDRVSSLQAITAAGGRCVPSEIRYDLPVLNTTTDTPVADDMMVRFGAARGGVVTLAPPVLSDVTGAISVWSEANDADPGTDGPATKPCLTVDCPDDSESIVDAIVRCLRFGNFRARFFGEQIQAILDLTAAAHARFMETRRLTAIGAGSTQVSTGQVLGVTRDVVATLRRASAAVRNFHRMPTNAPLRFGFPDWLFDMIATDLARQMPVGTLEETLAVAEATILRWFAVDGINPTPFLDGEPGQIFGPQGDGPLQGWPDTVVTYLYPEGTWLDLDGGVLDLGIMRDITSTETNDFQVFAESWQATHFFGVESWRIEMDVCPDGSASALVDIAPCGVGS
jgi:hypothetical protein